jgi:hypothetical protein
MQLPFLSFLRSALNTIRLFAVLGIFGLALPAARAEWINLDVSDGMNGPESANTLSVHRRRTAWVGGTAGTAVRRFRNTDPGAPASVSLGLLGAGALLPLKRWLRKAPQRFS